MSWIAELDTHGREFPSCVHVTKTTSTMVHGATYVPIEDGKAVRDENAKLRELVDGWDFCSKTKISTFDNCVGCPLFIQTLHSYRCARDERMRELEIEVD